MRRSAAEGRLLITGASSEFSPSLLALLGSLNLNWHGHPPVLVYDLGLDEATRSRLEQLNILVRSVPPFCPHWRQHFTWKIWCVNDAPALDVLWIDAGIVVLQPLDEIFQAIAAQGYFLVPNYELLDYEAPEAACQACGVSPEFRLGKPTLAGGLLGFRKRGQTGKLLKEALEIAKQEQAIIATNVAHRHDQAILSLLMYRYFGQVAIADGQVYLGWLSPQQVPGQKLWVHRRALLPADQQHFAAHIDEPGAPYQPAPPVPIERAEAQFALYKAHWWFGLGHLDNARSSLHRAFRLDASLDGDLDSLTRWLSWSLNNLARFAGTPSSASFELSGRDAFGDWVLQNLPRGVRSSFRRKLAGWFNARSAFQRYQAGDLAQARRRVLKSWLSDPSLLVNRGMLSILVQSFIGRKSFPWRAAWRGGG